jgi:hypothetical protein
MRDTHPPVGEPGGRPLDVGVRSALERHFGRGLGEVRLHGHVSAHREAGRLSARAFTIGRDVYFGQGAYAPSTPEGMALLAHEMAHVLQQRGATDRASDRPPPIGTDDEEGQADAAALTGDASSLRPTGLRLHRCSDGPSRPAGSTATRSGGPHPAPAPGVTPPAPPAPHTVFEQPGAITAAGASAAFRAYVALGAPGRRMAFQLSNGTGNLRRALTALGPRQAASSFPSALRELLGWITEADGSPNWSARFLGGVEREEALAESGQTLDQMARTQAAHEAARAQPPTGWGGTTTPRWTSLLPRQQADWTRRANAAIQRMTAYAQANHPELGVTTASFEWEPEAIDRISLGAIATEGSQPGRTLHIGFEFVVLVETNPAYAMSTVAHELLGHASYDAPGSNFQRELYDRARTADPSIAEGAETYHYWPSEIYSLLREYPYWTDVSAADRRRTLGLPGPDRHPQDLNYDPRGAIRELLGLIQDRWAPSLVVPVARGFLQRLRADPLITQDALREFETIVGEEFLPADAARIPR